jgi:predicted O-methyltransferase YrrM
MVSGRGWWRRGWSALLTSLGRPHGYFIPYRYAGVSSAPQHYAALRPAFAAATPEFRRRLAAAARYVPDLARLEGPPPAPRFAQDWFPRLDAAIAYALIRDAQASRIVEIGSGHSTRFMARAIADAALPTRLVAIDPAPRANLAGLAVEWQRKPLQAVDAAVFETLAAGDVLFIDSSHVLMPGSDVDRLLNEVLPRLPSGVLVHFHDIFLPDAYPEAWSWRGYNEQNGVAALLTGGGWRLLWSSHWAVTELADDLRTAGITRLPLMSGAHESSLWLQRV